MDYKSTYNVIGLGQCGTRIAQEFEKLGIPAAYINSDAGDARGLKSKNVFELDVVGTGASPIKGREMVNKKQRKFNDFLEQNASDKRINLVIAGAGGGTGGGVVAPTLEQLKLMGVKTGCLLTLPPASLGMLAVENAMRTLKEVKNVKLDTYVLADNEFLIKKCAIGKDWWNNVNKYIAQTVLSPFSIIEESKVSKTGFGSIDRGEINRILQYGNGLMDIRVVNIKVKDIKKYEDDKELRALLFEPSLVAGYEYKYSLAYIASIHTPDKGDYNEFSNRVLQITQKTAGSAMARVGTFVDSKRKDDIEIIMVNTGLKLPRSLQSKINNLKRDSQRFLDKKNSEERIDLSIEESVLNDTFSLD